MTDQTRYYQIAGITIQVESDLPFSGSTFSQAVESFRVAQPGNDVVTIHHHFKIPDLTQLKLGQEAYRKAPWVIFRQPEGWIYFIINSKLEIQSPFQVAVFNQDYSNAHIYHVRKRFFEKGNLNSLTLFPTDQILIARLLSSRNGCYLHSAGAILNGSGILFVGHSEAGKSTTTRILLQAGQVKHNQGSSRLSAVSKVADMRDVAPDQNLSVEILCDDRNIVRRFSGGWRVYGSWSHGDELDVSPASAPLQAICFLNQSVENSIIPLTDHFEITKRVLGCVIKPFVTTDWWHQTLDLVERMVEEVPCYHMNFDKSGKIVTELQHLIQTKPSSILGEEYCD